MRYVRNYGKAAIGLALVLGIVGCILMAARIAKAEPVDTYHSSWHLVRDTATENGATFAACLPLATNGGDFANMTASRFRISSRDAMSSEGYSAGGAWMFVFCGTDTNNDTFSFNLVGWSKTNGMAQVICEGNAILGTQDVVLYPDDFAVATSTFWADTIVLDETTKWPSVAVYNSGDNEVAFILVDMTGLEYVYPFIYDADGATGVEAVSVTVFGRRY